jgi:A/G-specific adenine glycosylase
MARLKLDTIEESPTYDLGAGRMLDSAARREFSLRVSRWGRKAARRVPWRASRDPFHVLMAELLLQRTSYLRVLPVYEELILTYRTPQELSAAPEDAIRSLLRPLGLANRAPRIIACSSAVVTRHGGRVPEAEEALVALPGVGNYVAKATRCIAFGHAGAAVDAPAARVLRRYFGLSTMRPAEYDRELWGLAEWLSRGTRRDYFFGLLDLGGTVCRPNPRCSSCPLMNSCATFVPDGLAA